MADTLWINADWTLAEWEDEELVVLIAFLWVMLKGAADERQAFIEQVHEGSFDADKEFPSFGDFTGFTISGSDSTNNVEKITAALNNTSGTKFDFVKTDTIKANGTTVANSARADYIDLGEILTDVLGYADDELLIALDTDDGTDTAIFKTEWTKQLFQVMNYPQYYARQIINTTDSFFSEIQTQDMALVVDYDYDTSLAPPQVTLARALYYNAPNAPVDLYVANDLKETAPYSTPQQIYDYTESTYDGQIAGADWVTVTDAVNTTLFSQATMSIVVSGTSTKYDASIQQRRLRFKVNENKRAASPNTYLAVLKLYFFLYSGTSSFTFSDFGIGVNELESELITLTPDGSDYYYLEPTTAPDFTTFNVPAYPATSVTVLEEYQQQSLNEFVNVGTPSLSTHRTDILIEPNLTDGTAFEYYTP